MITKEDISAWLKDLQSDICRQLEDADGGGKFVIDAWDRPGGGGGITRVLTDGNAIEKGGVNFSAVWGKTPAPVLQSLQIPADNEPDFFATGVSIVIHPVNPHVPIIHMNVRYFEMSNGVWWFGGGIDLTPHYVVPADARYFHQRLKAVCDLHDPQFYPHFKKWADDYFFIKHRNETRGIGGIFFDYLKDENGETRDTRFAFMKNVGLAFCPLYTYLLKKNAQVEFGSKEKGWQSLRRGRYVEFNLVWDRGTKFGLDTDGRSESILMSLPPQAAWEYRHEPIPSSAEGANYCILKKRDRLGQL